MALPTLVLKPHGQRILTKQWPNRRISYENGSEQVSRTTVNPIITWELTYTGTQEWMQELDTFFNARYGGVEPFYWTDENNETHIVKFTNDSLKITQKMGWNEQGEFTAVAFEAVVTIRKQ